VAFAVARTRAVEARFLRVCGLAALRLVLEAGCLLPVAGLSIFLCVSPV
jgi:hypothetical protein